MKNTLALLAVLALTPPSAALGQSEAPQEKKQEAKPSPEETAAAFQKSFDAGIAALNSGKNEEGIAAFETCLELDPENGTCAYNITCGYALMGKIDTAFEWFEKAATWGYGNSAANIEHAEKTDTDLAALRKDKRFAVIIESLKKALAKMEKLAKEEWGTAEIYLPETLASAKTVGALVVLHDAGSRKSDTIAAWKDRADRLGVMLVAPSGKFMAGPKLDDGMTWFTDPDEFNARYWKFEETVDAALKQANKKKPLDKSRTLIVGEGQGALIAFNAAMRAPRLYSSVVVIDGLPLVNLVESYTENAVSAGVKVRWVANPKALWGVPASESQAVLGGLSTALRQAKLDVKVERYTPDPKKPGARASAVNKVIDALLETVAVEAGAGK